MTWVGCAHFNQDGKLQTTMNIPNKLHDLVKKEKAYIGIPAGIFWYQIMYRFVLMNKPYQSMFLEFFRQILVMFKLFQDLINKFKEKIKGSNFWIWRWSLFLTSLQDLQGIWFFIQRGIYASIPWLEEQIQENLIILSMTTGRSGIGQLVGLV